MLLFISHVFIALWQFLLNMSYQLFIKQIFSGKLIYIIGFQIVTIMIAVCMMGYKNKNVSDYIKIFQLQSHEKNWVIKMVFTQVSIYVSLFFSMLVISGSLIKEQMPKKLVS